MRYEITVSEVRGTEHRLILMTPPGSLHAPGKTAEILGTLRRAFPDELLDHAGNPKGYGYKIEVKKYADDDKGQDVTTEIYELLTPLFDKAEA